MGKPIGHIFYDENKYDRKQQFLQKKRKNVYFNLNDVSKWRIRNKNYLFQDVTKCEIFHVASAFEKLCLKGQ